MPLNFLRRNRSKLPAEVEDDQPPAYMPMSEDQLNSLKKYDTVILLDDSGSMWGADKIFAKKSRWQIATEAVAQLAQKAIEYDKDGIDLAFINEDNSQNERKNIQNPDEVKHTCAAIKNTRRKTPTGHRVSKILKEYQTRLSKATETTLSSPKKLNLLIITDGEADDKELLMAAISAHARWLEEHSYPFDQTGIQFVQVGTDPDATKFLEKLDNDLQTWSPTGSGRGPSRDMVDTVPFAGGSLTGAELIKVLIGAINRKVDRQPSN